MRCPEMFIPATTVQVLNKNIHLPNFRGVQDSIHCSLSYNPCTHNGNPKDCPIYRKKVLGLKEQET